MMLWNSINFIYKFVCMEIHMKKGERLGIRYMYLTMYQKKLKRPCTFNSCSFSLSCTSFWTRFLCLSEWGWALPINSLQFSIAISISSVLLRPKCPCMYKYKIKIYQRLKDLLYKLFCSSRNESKKPNRTLFYAIRIWFIVKI